MTLHICEPIPESEFTRLHELLSKITIPKMSKNNRMNFDESRYACHGIVRQRKTGIVTLSAASRRHPEIWQEIQRIGSLLKGRDGGPFIFSSVHLNNNVTAGKHTDRNNIGDSILVGFGDYEGGQICLETGETEDIRHRPVCFNGSHIIHWNTPITSGSKYSLVFYVHKSAFNIQCPEEVLYHTPPSMSESSPPIFPPPSPTGDVSASCTSCVGKSYAVAIHR
jgi:hypothetical protein